MKLKGLLAYLGSSFFGWQKTSSGPSIQESLEKAFFVLYRHPIKVEGASRTDRGVHAQGQVFSIDIPPGKEINRLILSLNALLPQEIRVLHLEPITSSFHPSLDAQYKEYHYHICFGLSQSPFFHLTSWHYPYLLDRELMHQGALLLLGSHNFAALANEKQEGERTVYQISIRLLSQERLQISVIGNSFLYKMVRTLVGTLVYVGRGKILVSDLASLLKSKDRSKAGITAPAHGLTLYKVGYEEFTSNLLKPILSE